MKKSLEDLINGINQILSNGRGLSVEDRNVLQGAKQELEKMKNSSEFPVKDFAQIAEIVAIFLKYFLE